jgi:hypothetical protein
LLPGRHAATPFSVHPSVVLPADAVPAMNSSWNDRMVFGDTPMGKAMVKLFSVAPPALALGRWNEVSL